VQYIIFLSAFPYFYGNGSAYPFAVGPLLYLYVKSLIDKDFKFTLSALLHFVPFFFFHFQEIPSYFIADYENHFLNFGRFGDAEEIFLNFLVWHLQPLIYSGSLLRVLHKNSDFVKQVYKDSSRVNYQWMQNVFSVYMAIWILKTIVELFFPDSIFNQQEYYIPVSITLTSFHVYIIAYLGLNRSDDMNVEAISENHNQTERYKTSQLSEEKSKEYLEILLQNMESEELFKDPKLTLPSLANHLSINSRYLSQVINEKLGQNFYDFINGYRISEAKTRLMDPEKDKYTIEAIAFEVGFNSKAAFYSTFKKQTNMTPSQYREQQKNGSNPYQKCA